MPLTREQKEATIDQLETDLGRIKLLVMTDYRGLTVAELAELRHLLGEANINYRVTKNTLLRLAIGRVKIFSQLDPSAFTGPMALAFDFDDETTAAKLIFQFSKEHEALEIVGGLSAEGVLLDPSQIKTLANLPSRLELLAATTRTIGAPTSGLVRVLDANLKGLLNVFQAISQLNSKGV